MSDRITSNGDGFIYPAHGTSQILLSSKNLDRRELW